MEITVTKITLADISAVVRKELSTFFEKKNSEVETGDEIGGVDLAMKITGLAKATIYSRASARTIPHRKVGKKLYFSRMELSGWIDAGRRKTRVELGLAAENLLTERSK